MKLNEFEKSLANLTHQIYIFAGPEQFLKELTFKKICQLNVPQEYLNENCQNIATDSKNINTLHEQIFSFSFNEHKRVLGLNNFESLSGKAFENFVAKLENSPLPADMIVIFFAKNADVTRKLNTSFKDRCEKVDFWTPFANQMPAWTISQASSLKAKITPRAADLLIELADSNLSLIYAQLEKISSACKNIDLKDIKEHTGYLKQDNIFDFLDHTGQRNIKQAVTCLEHLFKMGVEPMSVWYPLSNMLSQYRLLHQLKQDRKDLFGPIFDLFREYKNYADKTDFRSNQQKREIVSNIQKQASEMPEVLSKAANLDNIMKIKKMYLALNYSLEELKQICKALPTIDSKLKSGTADAKAVLQIFTARLQQ